MLEKSPSLSAFKAELSSASSFLLENLWDSSKALFILFLQEISFQNIIIITGGKREDLLFDNLASLSDRSILEFPPWDALPEENLPPNYDIIGKRIEVLNQLLHKKEKAFILSPLNAILQKVISKEKLLIHIHVWKKGSRIPFATLPSFLEKLGYQRVATVSDKGEFALRGGIVDVFSTSAIDPCRIEFWGDEIESIRTFDPIGQRSLSKIEKVTITPANEQDLIRTEGACSLLDYLDDNNIIVFDHLVAIEDRYIALKNMEAKTKYLFTFEHFLERIRAQKQIFFSSHPLEELSPVKKRRFSKYFEDISFEIFNRQIKTKRFFHPFSKIESFLSPHTLEEEFSLTKYFPILQTNTDILFFIENEREKNEIKKHLHPPKTSKFAQGYLSSAVVITDIPLALIPFSEFSHKKRIRRQKLRSTYHTPAAEFHHLSPSDLVVHFHSGIGKYLGIEKQKNHQGKEMEFLVLEYAKNSKLYVPLSQAHLISRYIGAKDEIPPLNQLSSKKWINTKRLAQKQITGYASDLINLYAQRALQRGISCPEDSEDMQLFELDFPYRETKDQIDAISQIKKDMMSPKPMDRLICGDVGYGKTEVAMRAAFKAIVDGKKQVALLVPTTVLAIQHLETFKERMQSFPIIIEMVSRFFTGKENRKILQKTKEGKVDILIGTHRMLSRDVHFKNLGLIIIDEEQRFGVRSKEHLKKLKKNVDCLALSATPIPRTLYLSLVNIRDMSIINTPPQDRLPIKTIIAENSDEVIQGAILREITREGQIFFIHNRTLSIKKRAEHIQSLVPFVKIATVHGQMHSEEIDNIFHSFKLGHIDVLFATTIIENGIDIPNVNTIIVDNSDSFGLADLYQLRGRVGRWNRTAYCYLLFPKRKKLSNISKKRLSALLNTPGYGGGIKIAMRDLEIRGAGDILGVKQSGQISAVGFHLYCKLLKKAITALKEKKPISYIETKMEFFYDARLPDDYIYETNLRMEIYHRLGETSSLQEIDDILTELKDRFGPPPPPVIWLYHSTRLKYFASLNNFTFLKVEPSSLFAQYFLKKRILEKTITLPPFKSAKDLEIIIIKELQKHFHLGSKFR